MTRTNTPSPARAPVSKPAKPQRRMARPAPTDGASTSSSDTPAAVTTSPEPRITKSAAVITLLQREQGATLPELIEATGWLPHTTRAALTGIRKKGHAIAKDKRGTVTCYRITPAAV